MISKCHKCGGQIVARDSTVAGRLSAFGDVTFWSGIARCDTCNIEYVLSHTDEHPHQVTSWDRNHEVLREDRDFVWMDSSRVVPDGQKPLVVVWTWTPLQGSSNLGARMAKALAADEDLHRQDWLVLLVASYDNPCMVIMPVWHQGLFDAGILIKSHVLAGATGGLPSLRAEQSILRTWSACGLIVVKHYWPAVSLPAAGYIPLGTDAELTTVLAVDTRRYGPLRRGRRPQ